MQYKKGGIITNEIKCYFNPYETIKIVKQNENKSIQDFFIKLINKGTK